MKKPSIQIKRIFDSGNIHENDSVPNILYFGSPHFKIVTLCDKKIRILNLRMEENKMTILKTISEHAGDLIHAIKFSETIFLAGENYDIFGYSILPENEYKSLKRIRLPNSGVARLLKLRGDDLFLCSCFGGKLNVMSYSKGTTIRKLGNQRPNFVELEHSKLFKNCFFMNTTSMDSQYNESVKMINWNDDCVIKIAHHPRERTFIRTISTFMNKYNNEILIFGGNDKILYFYDCGSQLKDKPKLIQKRDFVKGYTIFCSSIVLDDKYLFLGDGGGRVHIFDLRKKGNGRVDQITFNRGKYGGIAKEQVYPSQCWVNDFKVVQKDFSGGQTKVICACSAEGKSIAVFSVTGLDLVDGKNKQSLEDLSERIEFVRASKEFYISEDLRKKFGIKMKFLQSGFCVELFRSFF